MYDVRKVDTAVHMFLDKTGAQYGKMLAF